MFRARERGMSFWPFAVSLVVLIVMVFLWFSANSEVDQWKRTAETNKRQREDAEKSLTEANVKLLAIQSKSGFPEGPAIEAKIKEYGPKLQQAMTATFDENKYDADPSNPVGTTKVAGNKVNVQYLLDTEVQGATTLESFFSLFEVAGSRMRKDIERAFNNAAQAAADKEAVVKADQETIKQKEARIGELTTEKSALDSRMHEQENELKAQIQQKDAQVSKLEADSEAARKKASETEAKLTAQVNEATGHVRTLVQREAPQLSEGPDGEVVLADNGVAIVNRGRTNWLMPGTIFDVLGRAKGGATYKKGSIKITNVDDATARGAVLEESAKDPISRGDLIQSLTYSPNRQLRFVLVGDFKKMGRSQAESLLKKLGAQVDAKVSSETNYLVVGAVENFDENPEVKTAKDLGIRTITEEQLASFARY